MRSLMIKITTAILMLGILGCQNSAKGTSGSSVKLYDIAGVVMAIDAKKNTVTLDHEDIPGLMRAMKMSFAVEDSKTLTGLNQGDKVVGKLKVKSDGKQQISELKKKNGS